MLEVGEVVVTVKGIQNWRIEPQIDSMRKGITRFQDE